VEVICQEEGGLFLTGRLQIKGKEKAEKRNHVYSIFD
jgi:hypothetical protein